uniref:EF-hand domain-containing protein n=1 Tax=Rhabditophanes sp. KR3021 TaxID=114890 RepID=A0AC35TYG5_9BILA
MAIPITDDPLNQHPIIGYEEEIEEEIVPVYRPESLSAICKMTKFTTREVRVMYRAFKQGCPTGVVNLKQFQAIYAHFFPQSNSQRYAEFVFRTFDKDNDDYISFQDFVTGLSIISRGSPQEKVSWIFDLYDIHKRNYIGPADMLAVVHSIYELLGNGYFPPVNKNTIVEQVIDSFNKITEGKSQIVTRDQFINTCTKNLDLLKSLDLFATICNNDLVSVASKTLPAKQAVQKHEILPVIKALTITFAKSVFLDGAIDPSVARIIPMDAILENPHKAKVAIICDFGVNWEGTDDVIEPNCV